MSLKISQNYSQINGINRSKVSFRADFAKFKVTNPELWAQRISNTQQNPEGKIILEKAARWAELMEEAIKKGAKLADIAETTSLSAGISDSLDTIVNVLCTVWKHGKALGKWSTDRYKPKGRTKKF